MMLLSNADRTTFCSPKGLLDVLSGVKRGRQKGLSVPSTLEMQALNEGMANIGAGIGSSFTINQNAGAAIVSDLTRGVLQGGSQYLSKKFRTVKVNLKANYQVMLFTKQ